MTRPLVIAHRGASAREYENSLAAFRAAARLGADGVELDIHATSDGGLIVHHDPRLADRRAIPELTLRDVQTVRLPNGEPVPTLAQALDACGSGLRVFVEVKSLPPQYDRRLLDVLDQGPNPAGYAVHSFDHRIVRRLGITRTALARGVLSSSYPVRPVAALQDAGGTILWQERTLVDADLVEALHAQGCRLFVWTVDDAAEMRGFTRLGVDAICTNTPDVGRQVLGPGPGGTAA